MGNKSIQLFGISEKMKLTLTGTGMEQRKPRDPRSAVLNTDAKQGDPTWRGISSVLMAKRWWLVFLISFSLFLKWNRDYSDWKKGKQILPARAKKAGNWFFCVNFLSCFVKWSSLTRILKVLRAQWRPRSEDIYLQGSGLSASLL